MASEAQSKLQVVSYRLSQLRNSLPIPILSFTLDNLYRRRRRFDQHTLHSLSISSKISTMDDCNFPEDLMLCILTRLPVKSLCRFKCVCKFWHFLFSSSDFIALHRDVTASNPENHSLLIYPILVVQNDLFFLRINSAIVETVKVCHELPRICFHMELVGSYNGLVGLICLYFSAIILWNPAIRQWKSVRLPDNPYYPLALSVGMGFDSSTDDFKVLSIIYLRTTGKAILARVYSTNRDCWVMVGFGFTFRVFSTRNYAIIGGVPYWRGVVNDFNCGEENRFVRYDAKKGVFDHIPLPKFDLNSKTNTHLVEWKNCPALFVHSSEKENQVSVMLFDECRKWITQFTFGNIGISIARQIQCSEGGKMLLETVEGKLFLFDPKTYRMEEISIMGACPSVNEAVNYTESLVRIKDMKPVGEIEGLFHFDFYSP